MLTCLSVLDVLYFYLTNEIRKPVKTADVDEMISNLPPPEQLVVKRLRALIIECLPQSIEKTYYDLGIPFYTRNRLICFIWPPSVVWEKTNHEKRQEKGVSLGFNQGNRMSNEDGVLLSEGRKQVYVMYFKTVNDIDEAKVRALLFEAAMIDEQFAKKKKK